MTSPCRDIFFPPAPVDALEKRLKEGKVNCEIYRCQANHAFGNETGPYNKGAANLAWQRSTDFLAKHLK